MVIWFVDSYTNIVMSVHGILGVALLDPTRCGPTGGPLVCIWRLHDRLLVRKAGKDPATIVTVAFAMY